MRKMGNTIFIFFFSVFVHALSMGTNNRPCRSVRISNGNVKCPNNINHQSICTFHCNDNFQLQSDSLQIYCDNGVWQYLDTNFRFDFGIEYCIPTDSSDVPTSTKETEECSDDVCGYNGIPKGVCLGLGCCWDDGAAGTRCRGRIINDSPCPAFYNGAPRSVCDGQTDCYYDNLSKKCFLRETESLIESRELLILPLSPRNSLIEECPNLLESFPDAQWELLRFSCSKQSKTGSTCVFDCDVTHAIVGNNRLKCNNGGEWEGRPPMCLEKQLCPTFYNGAPRDVCDNAEHCYYDVSEKMCYRDLQPIEEIMVLRQLLVGSPQTAISSQGPKECPDLREEFPSIDWTILQFSCSNEFNIGSTCVLVCNDQYIVAGNKRLRCGADGKWENKPLACIMKREELKTCNLKLDLNSKTLSQKTIENQTSEYININYIKPANTFRSTNRQVVLEINYSEIQSLSIQMEYSSPSSDHFEIGDMTSSLKGSRLHLYKGNGREVPNMFSNSRKVIFHSRRDEPTLYYTVISTRNNRVIRSGGIQFNEMGEMEKVYLSTNRLIDTSVTSRARGMKSLCISYTT